MTRVRVEVDGAVETVNTDAPLRAEWLPWAVLRAEVVDELTTAAPRVPLTLINNLRRGSARLGAGGVLGLVARPADVTQALLQPGALTARIEAPGYLPRELTPQIDAVRRQLLNPVAPPIAQLDVVAPRPDHDEQFHPGRGVWLEREVLTDDDEFHEVVQLSAPGAGEVRTTTAVGRTYSAGRRLSGVPMQLPPQPLHRARPLRLRGRVMRAVGVPPVLVPEPAARIGIAGVWFTYPAALTQPPVVPMLGALVPPAVFDHPVGTAIETCTLTAGTPRRLLEALPLGATELRLAPGAGLNPAGGDLLSLSEASGTHNEVVRTVGCDVATVGTAAVTVRLAAPTSQPYRLDARIVDVSAGAFAAVGTTTREIQRGDAVLFGSNVTALPAGSAIVLDRAGLQPAYHTLDQLPRSLGGGVFSNLAQIDLDGFFDWPPLARLAQLRVLASLGGFMDQTIDLQLDYRNADTEPAGSRAPIESRPAALSIVFT